MLLKKLRRIKSFPSVLGLCTYNKRILTASSRIKGGASQTFDVTDVVLKKKDDNIKFIQDYTFACKKGYSQEIAFTVVGKT